MPTGRHGKRRADDPGLSRRRFLRAAGVGSAGAMVAAGAAMGQAGADVAAAVPTVADPAVPARRQVVRAGGQRAAAAAGLAVSGPLSFHTISPRRYLDTRTDGGGALDPQAGVGEFYVFDFGNPDYFSGGVANEVPAGARAIACNLTVTGGTAGGNLRGFPGNSDVIPQFANLNWLRAQTAGNYAIIAAATPADGTEFAASVGLHNASAGAVHVIVDISGFFM